MTELKRNAPTVPPRRRPSQADMERVLAGTKRKIGLAVKEYVTTDKGAVAFGQRMAKTLEERYARASQLGRNRAGDVSGKNKLDRELAQAIGRSQEKFLRGFVADLKSGKYEKEGLPNVSVIQRRAESYSETLIAVANEAFVSASVMYQISWVMGGAEKHCSRCPELASGSPYDALELPTVPKGGATPCLYNCRCFLVRSDGVEGFR